MDEMSGAAVGANISPTPCFPGQSTSVRGAEGSPAVGVGTEAPPVPASFSFSSGDGRGGQAHWGPGMYPPHGGHQPPPFNESPWAHYHQGGSHQDQPMVGRLDAGGDPFCPLPLDQQQQQQVARAMMMGSAGAPPTPTGPSPDGAAGTGGTGTSTSTSTPQYGGSGMNNNIFPNLNQSQSGAPQPQPPPGGYDATPPSDDLSSHNSEDTETSSSSQGKDPLRAKEKKKSRAPRRPLTAYKLFFRQERSKIFSEEGASNGDGDGALGAKGDDPRAKGDRRGRRSRTKAQLADLSREVKRRWRLLTPEQKTYFEHMAREESQRYEGFYGEDQQGGRVSSGGDGASAAVGTTTPGGADPKRSPPGAAADPYASPSQHDPAWDPPRSSRPQRLPEDHQVHQHGNVGYHPQRAPFASAPHYYPSPIRTDTRSRMDGSSRSAPGHGPHANFPQDRQQSRPEQHGQHEQGQYYHHPHPEGSGLHNPHHPPPPHVQQHHPTTFPLAPQWIDSSDGSQPVRLPPPSCVVVHDADGVPRRYQLMYAAVSMPPESAGKYLMSVFSAARGMMGRMTEEDQPPMPVPVPQPGVPSSFLPGPPPPEGGTGPGDPRFSRGDYPHPHPHPPPGR